MSDRPNILFIVSDQHNAKVTGYSGHPDVRTPHLDRMATEGVLCRNAITQNPICTPSRVSFLSGQYCHNHGYYGLSGRNPQGLPNIFGHFRPHGYLTAALGKIHCPEYWVEDQCDIFHDTCHTSVGGRSQEYEAFLTERGKLELEDHGALPEWGARGRQTMEGRPSPLTFDESQEGWIAHKAVSIMRDAQSRGRPFLIHCSLPRPHQCTAPSPEFWGLYAQDRITLPPNADHDMQGKAPHMRETVARWRRGDWTLYEPHGFEAGRLRKQHGYLGAVSQVDAAVGVMLDAVRDLGLAENTIVIYTADHGDYASEFGIMEKAPGICSDAITRVPMIWWSPPRFAAGKAVNSIVELVDISATLCAQAGLPAMETSDGKDISPLLQGQETEIHAFGMTEFAWSKSIRKGHFRLVYYPPRMFPQEYPAGFGELYDLHADPYEITNLYPDPAYREVVQELQTDLLHFMMETLRPNTVNGVNTARQGMEEESPYRYRFRTWSLADGKIPTAWFEQATTRNYI